jgi:hypothetical protein
MLGFWLTAVSGFKRLIKTFFTGAALRLGNYRIFAQTGSMEKDFIKNPGRKDYYPEKRTLNGSVRLNVKNQMKCDMVSC